MKKLNGLDIGSIITLSVDEAIKDNTSDIVIYSENTASNTLSTLLTTEAMKESINEKMTVSNTQNIQLLEATNKLVVSQVEIQRLTKIVADTAHNSYLLQRENQNEDTTNDGN